MSQLLAIHDLQIEFNTQIGIVQAVNGISFAIDSGETVAIVGESGSGKSVSALAMLGLLPQPPARIISGQIQFDGQNILTLAPEALRKLRGHKIGMIFQEPMTSLNPVLSIGRQITETLRQHLGLSARAARTRAIELLNQVGIADPERRLKQYPHHLSGGMRQRVMIAIAISCEPRLLIADEPTTALDVTIQAQILLLLKTLTQRLGAALILITHNLGIVARYADRVNVMYAGRIVEEGPAADVYRNPSHPYTLGLLNSVPRLDRPRQFKLDPIPGQPPDPAHLSTGCTFRPRCRYQTQDCATTPTLQTVHGAHRSACWQLDSLHQITASDQGK